MPHVEQETARQREVRVIYRILSHRLFRRMMHRQGIDLTEHWWRRFDEMIFRAMHRCAACGSRDACRRWLAEHHPQESCPSFCPNADAIAACRILDPHAAAPQRNDVEIAGRREPPLAEVLTDPIVRQLIDADRAKGGKPHGRLLL